MERFTVGFIILSAFLVSQSAFSWRGIINDTWGPLYISLYPGAEKPSDEILEKNKRELNAASLSQNQPFSATELTSFENQGFAVRGTLTGGWQHADVEALLKQQQEAKSALESQGKKIPIFLVKILPSYFGFGSYKFNVEWQQ